MLIIVPTDRLFYNLYWWEINFTWIWYIFVHYLFKRNNVFFFYISDLTIFIILLFYFLRYLQWSCNLTCLFFYKDELKKKKRRFVYKFFMFFFLSYENLIVTRSNFYILFFCTIYVQCVHFLFYNGTIFCTFFFFFFF